MQPQQPDTHQASGCCCFSRHIVSIRVNLRSSAAHVFQSQIFQKCITASRNNIQNSPAISLSRACYFSVEDTTYGNRQTDRYRANKARQANAPADTAEKPAKQNST